MVNDMKKYPMIDIFKLLFAIGIVAIHCNLFQGTDNVSWYILHGILRIGVPFFFCVSGFFYCRSLDSNKGDVNVLKKYIKRIGIPFIFWTILNFFIFYHDKCIGLHGIKLVTFILKNLLFYPWGAMWYLLALMLSLILLYPFYKKKKLGLILIIGALLYLFGLVGNNYYFAILGTKLQLFMEWYSKHFLCTRNALFEGLYFTGVGMYISRMKNIPNIWLVIVNYIILVIEIFTIKGHMYLDDHSLYFSFIFFIPIFVLYLTKFDVSFDTSKIRNYSSGIYFMHRFIFGNLTILGITNNILLFISTIVITIVLLTIGYMSKNKYVLKVIK